MEGKLGAAYVEFGGRPQGFYSALAGVQKATLGLGGSLGQAGLSAGTKFATALSGALGGATKGLMAIGAAYPGLRAATSGLMSIVTAGSDLNEVTSAVEQTFGKASSTITGAAQNAADKFGTVKTEYLESAVGLGALAQGMGMADDAAAQFAVTYTDLAADLSSFRNVPFSEALLALRSGLSGEAEPLKRFGVNIKENQVASMGWAMGLARVGEALTDEQKAIARAQLIMVGLKKAQGDLGRTQDGMANRMRKAQGSIANSWADLGTAIQPAAVRIMEAIGGGIGGAVSWLQSNAGVFTAWADAAAGSFGRAWAAVSSWGSGFMSFVSPIGGALGRLGATFWGCVETVGGALGKVGGLLGGSGGGFAGWGEIVAGAIDVVTAVFGTLWGVASSVVTAISDSIADNWDVFEGWGRSIGEILGAAGEWLWSWKDTASDVFSGVGAFLKSCLDGVMFFARNAGAFFTDFGLTISQWATDAVEYGAYFGDWIKTFGSWLLENFPAIFYDACTATLSVVKNFAINLIEVCKAAWEWLASGGTVEFGANANFRGLLDDFERTSKQMDEVKGPSIDHTETDRQRQALWDGVADSEVARNDRKAKQKADDEESDALRDFLQDQIAASENWKDPSAGKYYGGNKGGFAAKGGQNGDVMGPEDQKQKSEVLKVADLSTKVQEGVVGKESDTKKQTKTQNQMLEVQKQQLKLMEKPRGAVLK